MVELEQVKGQLDVEQLKNAKQEVLIEVQRDLLEQAKPFLSDDLKNRIEALIPLEPESVLSTFGEMLVTEYILRVKHGLQELMRPAVRHSTLMPDKTIKTETKVIDAAVMIDAVEDLLVNAHAALNADGPLPEYACSTCRARHFTTTTCQRCGAPMKPNGRVVAPLPGEPMQWQAPKS